MLPTQVDSSEQFSNYKKSSSHDVTFEYFENYENISNLIKYVESIDYSYIDDYKQFSNYKEINYEKIILFVKKYFTPQKQIFNIVNYIEKNFYIDNYENICVLFYRGNDKSRETKLCTYDKFISKADNLLKDNPHIVFLIQSDETEFIYEMKRRYPNNSFWFKGCIRHMTKRNDTVDNLSVERINEFSKFYLAITIIMSKCKYIICTSGNCSLWIMFYRENVNNVLQNLNDNWL